MVSNARGSGGLTAYLSPFAAFALSVGCSVGWGAFVMPGTIFLPGAGPLGTLLGIALGAALMLGIGMNYHYLMQRYPDAGTTFSVRIPHVKVAGGFSQVMAPAPRVDLVLTDMWMPKMNGEALVRAIRANPKLADMPVYAVTADIEIQKTYKSMGFTGIFIKPVTIEMLKSAAPFADRRK